MRNTTLVILAAGLGSRYGGDKQIAGVGPADETLLEFTLFDALRSGITSAIAVVRPSVAERVAALLSRAPGLQWSLVEQPSHRPRPWGTAHALYCAMETVDAPVVVVNADDWYGPGAMAKAVELLDNGADLALTAHQLGRTLSHHGPVNRGVCRISHGQLTAIEEAIGIVPDPAGARYSGGLLSADAPVSLNLWSLTPAVKPFLAQQVNDFLATHCDDPKSEIYIPDVVAAWIASGRQVRSEVCHEDWCGLTHLADRPQVVSRLAQATAAGVYPSPLWIK